MTIDRHQHNMIVCLASHRIWAPNSQQAIRYSYFKQLKLKRHQNQSIKIERLLSPKKGAGHDSTGKVPWIGCFHLLCVRPVSQHISDHFSFYCGMLVFYLLHKVVAK